MVLWFLVVTGQPLIPKEKGEKGVKNNGELLMEESLKQETVKTLTHHEEQYIATHNNSTLLTWHPCFPSPILQWAGETGARSSSSSTMGKEAGPFAQELGRGEIFLHCSREGGGQLQPLLFSSILPSAGHTQHSQEGGGVKRL